MGFIKIDDSILRNPKLYRLSMGQRWLYVACLSCVRQVGGLHGELPMLKTVSVMLGLSTRRTREFLCVLEGFGFLDVIDESPIGGCLYRIHNWDKWQGSKDPAHAERQRKYRERLASREASRNGRVVTPHANAKGQKRASRDGSEFIEG